MASLSATPLFPRPPHPLQPSFQSAYIRLVLVVGLLAACNIDGGGPVARTFVVNSAGDAGDSSPGDNVCRTGPLSTECTLRAAMEEANASAGSDRIEFDLPTGIYAIHITSALPAITAPLILDGSTHPEFDGGKPPIYIDGDGIPGADPVDGFVVQSGVEAEFIALQVLRFRGVGIRNLGTLSLDHVELAGNGGGVDSFIASGSLSVLLTDTAVTENHGAGIGAINTELVVTGGAISHNNGNGIWMNGGSLNVTDTLIQENHAASEGGGIMAANPSIVVLQNVSLESNTSGTSGGGLYYWGLPASTLMIRGGTIHGNEAVNGGGVYLAAGSALISGTHVTWNMAAGWGGGIYLDSENDASLTINDHAVIGGAGAGNAADTDGAGFEMGGGIFSKGTLHVTDTEVSGNLKGGIYNEGGTVFVQDGDISENDGPGIMSFISGTPVPVNVRNCRVVGNESDGISAINAILLVVESTIADNHGSGISQNGGKMSVFSSTISGNSTGGNGGGISSNNLLNGLVQWSTVEGNHADGSGGGWYAWAVGTGSFSAVNSTFSGNTAGTTGGAIEAARGNMFLLHATLTGNSAPSAGGIHIAGSATVGNSILSGNAGGNCAGPLTSYGYNIENGNICGFANVGDMVMTDPLLAPLADNGGPTRTHALLPSSPALDSASTEMCEDRDQRGVSRPQGAGCDIGAFEKEADRTPAPATPTLTPTSTPTITPTPEGLKFDPVEPSGTLIWLGAGCGPTNMTLRVRVTPSDNIYSVVVFLRLLAQDQSERSGADSGTAMDPKGDGWYEAKVSPAHIPGANEWKKKSWLLFQFVATAKDKSILGRSPYFDLVTVQYCKQYQ